MYGSDLFQVYSYEVAAVEQISNLFGLYHVQIERNRWIYSNAPEIYQIDEKFILFRSHLLLNKVENGSGKSEYCKFNAFVYLNSIHIDERLSIHKNNNKKRFATSTNFGV